VLHGLQQSCPAGWRPTCKGARFQKVWSPDVGSDDAGLVPLTHPPTAPTRLTLCGRAAESGGWDAAARVAREGPLMTPLQPALQECLECRVAMLRPSTPATPPRSESQRGPLFGMRLEELVMADLQRAGLCAAAAAHSACSVRRGAKRARLSSPPAPAAWPALPVALTAGSGAWAGAEAEADLDESELDEAVTCSAGSDSCGSDASDAELEDDAQSTSPTFSFQAWPAPGPGRAGSAESVSGGLSCGRSAPRA